MPGAICPQHTYWYWKPPDLSGENILTIGYDKDRLGEFYERVEPRARAVSERSLRVERDLIIYFCSGLKKPFDEVWSELKRF